MKHGSLPAVSTRIASLWAICGKSGDRPFALRPRTSLIAFLAMCSFLLLALCGCGCESDSVKQLVKSGEGAVLDCLDGKVSLQIPAGALSEDTEVTLSVLPKGDWTDDTLAVGPVGPVLRLEPDGLELLKPVTLSTILDPTDLAHLGLAEGDLPVCVVLTRSDDGQWDLMENLVTLVDAGSGKISLLGETTHFSDAVTCYDQVTVRLTPKSVEAYDSEPWPGTVTVKNGNRVPLYIAGADHHASGAVSPATAAGPRKTQKVPPGGSVTVEPSPSWWCRTTGEGEYMVVVSCGRERRYSDWEEAQKKLDPDYLEKTTSSAPPVDSFGIRQVLIGVCGSASCYLPDSPTTKSTTTTRHPNDDRPPICELTFDPNPCAFGEVLVGDEKTLTVTLANTGEVDVIVLGYGWPTDPFSAISTVPQGLSLPVGASYEYTFQFSPPGEDDYNDTMGVFVAFRYKGVWFPGAFSDSLTGTGVLTEVGMLLIDMEGWWELTPAGELMTLDFHMALSDISKGENPITLVNLYIDDLETPAYSSGPISVTEFPPPPGMIWRRDVTPGIHVVMAEVFTADGHSITETWEIDCGTTQDSETQECTGQPDCTCDVCK